MSSGVSTGNIPIASVVQGRETAPTGGVQAESGKSLPPGGKFGFAATIVAG